MLAALAVFGLAESASARTFYIAANGLDSHPGTSKTAPWLHAPGMPNCTATCASVTPGPGDKFIFRGGDVWHTANSSASPYTGNAASPADSRAISSWNWQWSGSSANCNWPAKTSSCIYIGVDKSWYSGSSWTRPAFDLDNPLSKSLVGSCSYDQSTRYHGLAFGTFYGYPNYATDYLIIDGFDFYGSCHSGTNPPASYIDTTGTYIAIIDSYFHGYTMTNNPQPNGQTPQDQSPMISNNYTDAVVPGGATHNIVAYDVFDGSDSYCTGVDACSGEAANITYDFEHNVVRYMSNALNGPSNVALVHDNLFEHMYESYDPAAHGGIIEQNGNDLKQPMQWYNNVFRHTNMGITLNPDTTPSSPLYFFNNVMYDIGNPSNCIALASASSSTGQSAYIVNDTVDANSTGCSFRLSKGGAPEQFQGTIHFENLHLIGTGTTTISGWVGTPPSGITIDDGGNHVFQSESAANGQGYTPANDYQPTSANGATYHQGADLSSQCTTYSSDSSLCRGSTGAVTNTPGKGDLPTLVIAAPASRGSTWDTGAYQFAPGVGSGGAPDAGGGTAGAGGANATGGTAGSGTGGTTSVGGTSSSGGAGSAGRAASPNSSSGCGCAVPGREPAVPAGWLACALSLGLIVERRRRRTSER